MKAMILAAGEGRRMRPLTLDTPKPLLLVNGKALIEHHIERLKAAGFGELIVNVAYLGEKVQAALGDGSRFGVTIAYSVEPEPLDTGGAIARALPLLGGQPFVLINGDIWTDYPLERLQRVVPCDGGAHLVLVPNPEHHAAGDFALDGAGQVSATAVGERFTFSGISVLSPGVVQGYPQCRSRFPLAEALRWAAQKQAVSGELYCGRWVDVGTPERLAELQ